MDDISSFLRDKIRLKVGQETIAQAVKMIAGCECCTAAAEIPFDWILDRVTGLQGSVTDYILEAPAKCSNCRRETLEETLIGPAFSGT